MYKKVRCTYRVVVLLIKPIIFFTFPLPSSSWVRKVPSLMYATLKKLKYAFFKFLFFILCKAFYKDKTKRKGGKVLKRLLR